MKIKRIAEIKNFSIFKDFDWASNLSYQIKENTEIYDFKDINIFYGRNYSGKTSLSKIIRALEKKALPPKYNNPSFELELNDGKRISQTNLSEFIHPIHVYNSDFVKENLKFIHDENANIESFSVTLGGNNQQILERIQDLKNELGIDQENAQTGLHLFIKNKKTELENAQNNHSNKTIVLNDLLANEATKKWNSIKNQHEKFGDINFNITKLNRDIAIVQDSNYTALTDVQINRYASLITQRDLPEPPLIPPYNLNFSELVQSADSILRTVVGGSQKIEELVTNNHLNVWVQTGHQLHLDRTTCAFCSNQISDERRDELRHHFDEETQKLQNRISKGIEHLNKLLDGSSFKIDFDISHYYQQYHHELSQLKIDLKTSLDKQKVSIKQFEALLKQKNGHLFTELKTTYPDDYSEEIETIFKKISTIRTTCIELNSGLASRQKEAKEALRLNHIYHFLQDINYNGLNTEIEKLQQAITLPTQDLLALNTRKTEILNEIQTEQNKLKSEGEACIRINNILNHDFGHQHLSLEPIEVDTINGKAFKFEIRRNSTKAHNLSEGEQSLISFCYFLVKVQEDLEQNQKPIIWIDDPICSLDSNHIFFIYSLINNQICKSKQFSQLFISTHNLEFLKYLKRLDISFNNNGAKPNLKVSKYVIQRVSDNSYINIMPVYMSEYATEFNYLFKQIHTCATENLITDQNHGCFYNLYLNLHSD